jgi:hypothetical protein
MLSKQIGEFRHWNFWHVSGSDFELGSEKKGWVPGGLECPANRKLR